MNVALLLEALACGTIGGFVGSLIVLARQGRVHWRP